jgi:MarR family transcriptional regulator, lower aerobic nicotinate degradation pathway regulator
VSLTAEGRALVDQVAARFGTEVRGILEPLSHAEQGQLTEMLGRVLTAYADSRGIALR